MSQHKLISKIDSSLTLDKLIHDKENQYLERKGKDIKPTKLANELIGMLNADGGILALGVTDNGALEDLTTLSASNLERYKNIVFDLVKPPANIRVEQITLESGELIFLYHVEPDYERLFCRNDNEEVYLRVHDETRRLNRDQIRKLEYDKSIRKFEDEIRADFNTNDLREKLLEFYKSKMNYSGEVFDLLVKRHLATKVDYGYKFKNSAILLFAEDPEKYIPSASVRYVRYSGIDAKVGVDHNVIKDERFEGAIPVLIERLKRFVSVSLKDYYYLDITIGKFKKITEYPEEAWLEGIVNALCHRSYNLQGNTIYLKHFDDRIEISNSGPLPAQVTVKNIRNERFSRNPRIARVLSDMGYVRELNEGVKRIFESMEKSMLSEPEYYDQNNTITLVLRNRVAGHEKSISSFVMKLIELMWDKTNNSEKKILQYLFVNSQGTINDFTLEAKINVRSTRRYLNKFIKIGIVEKKSPKSRDINSTYSLVKND